MTTMAPAKPTAMASHSRQPHPLARKRADSAVSIIARRNRWRRHRPADVFDEMKKRSDAAMQHPAQHVAKGLLALKPESPW